uniref:Internal scaffolding protein n=1 Tax=Dulem virus 188 TaxID=3145665 RepID=A0AAU8AVI8_9VIRU
MNKFRTQFTSHARVNANPGTREKVLYSPKFADDGSMELIEAGRENLYEYIQSHKESVDINVILKRFARGDVGALQRRQAMFGDFMDAPTSYAEALNSMIVAEQYFNSLPLETRAKFDHNFHRFLVSMDSPDFADKLSPAQVVPPSFTEEMREQLGEAEAARINTTPDTPSS